MSAWWCRPVTRLPRIIIGVANDYSGPKTLGSSSFLANAVVGCLGSYNKDRLQREPSSFNDFVRGKSTSYPFAPGGVSSLHENKPKLQGLDREFDELIKGEGDGKLLTTPPGFESGLLFENKESE
jgi:hypothetical protein